MNKVEIERRAEKQLLNLLDTSEWRGSGDVRRMGCDYNVTIKTTGYWDILDFADKTRAWLERLVRHNLAERKIIKQGSQTKYLYRRKTPCRVLCEIVKKERRNASK